MIPIKLFRLFLGVKDDIQKSASAKRRGSSIDYIIFNPSLAESHLVRTLRGKDIEVSRGTNVSENNVHDVQNNASNIHEEDLKLNKTIQLVVTKPQQSKENISKTAPSPSKQSLPPRNQSAQKQVTQKGEAAVKSPPVKPTIKPKVAAAQPTKLQQKLPLSNNAPLAKTDALLKEQKSQKSPMQPTVIGDNRQKPQAELKVQHPSESYIEKSIEKQQKSNLPKTTQKVNGKPAPIQIRQHSQYKTHQKPIIQTKPKVLTPVQNVTEQPIGQNKSLQSKTSKIAVPMQKSAQSQTRQKPNEGNKQLHQVKRPHNPQQNGHKQPHVLSLQQEEKQPQAANYVALTSGMQKQRQPQDKPLSSQNKTKQKVPPQKPSNKVHQKPGQKEPVQNSVHKPPGNATLKPPQKAPLLNSAPKPQRSAALKPQQYAPSPNTPSKSQKNAVIQPQKKVPLPNAAPKSQRNAQVQNQASPQNKPQSQPNPNKKQQEHHVQKRGAEQPASKAQSRNSVQKKHLPLFPDVSTIEKTGNYLHDMAILTIVTSSYLDFTVNWLITLERLGGKTPKIYIVAEDRETYNFFRTADEQEEEVFSKMSKILEDVTVLKSPHVKAKSRQLFKHGRLQKHYETTLYFRHFESWL